MRVKPSATSGSYSGDLLAVYVQLFGNPIAGTPTLEHADGFVFDSRDSHATRGQLTVQAAQTTGMWAYTPRAQLVNLAIIGGAVSSQQITVLATTDDTTLRHGAQHWSDVTNSGASCSSRRRRHGGELSVLGCAVQLTSSAMK